MKTTIVTLLAALLLGLGLSSPASAENDAPWSGHCWKVGNYNYALRDGGTIETTIGSSAPAKPTYWGHRCADNGVRWDVVRANTADEVRGLAAEVRDGNKGPGVPYLFCRVSDTRAYLVGWSWYIHDITERPGERDRYAAWAHTWKQTHNCQGAR